MKKIDLITRILFFIGIAGAMVLWIFAPYLLPAEYEDRKYLIIPEIAENEQTTFPSEFEKAFNGNLPFKGAFITVQSTLQYYVFGEVNTSKVLAGENEMMFYYNEVDGSSKYDYKRTRLFSPEELEVIKDNLEAAQKKVHENGSEFVLYIAANKEQVYSENMPEDILVKENETRVDQLVKYLKENTDIIVISPKEELIAAKQNHPTYFGYDSHWNEYGAYIGFACLMDELGLDYEKDITVTPRDNFEGGDMEDMLKLDSIVKETRAVKVSGFSDAAVTSYDDENGITVMQGGSNGKNIFFVRDSFFTLFAPYSAKTFDTTYARHVDIYKKGEAFLYETDYVVYETVERYLHRLLTLEL